MHPTYTTARRTLGNRIACFGWVMAAVFLSATCCRAAAVPSVPAAPPAPSMKGGSATATLAVVPASTVWKYSDNDYIFSFNRQTGVWDVQWGDGKPGARGAVPMWSLSGAEGATGSDFTPSNLGKAALEEFNFADRLGFGKALLVRYAPQGAPRFELEFHFYENAFLTVRSRVVNRGNTVVAVRKLAPMQIAPPSGGLFLGPRPESAWILENGHKYYFDFWVRLVSATAPFSSNWDAAFFDPDTNRAAVVGFVTSDHGIVSVRGATDIAQSATDTASGWRPLTNLTADVTYTPAKSLSPGERLESETLFVGLSRSGPHAILETFGDAVNKAYNIKPRLDDIPTGWNSWSTGYDKDIDEGRMLDNARWVKRYLEPYGMRDFKIDDGWQMAVGDWEPNSTYPNGMKEFAGRLREMGLRPGIWIAPFCVSVNSQLLKDHPDWILQRTPRLDMLVPKDWEVLDLTRPDVQDWLRTLFRKIAREWDFGLIKIDFIYYELLGEKFHDPSMTNVEAYRKGLQIIREAIGPDVHLMAVGVPIAYGAGVVDSMRVALDNTPDWGDRDGYGTQGLKRLVQCMARRYYLNHRVWVNHPDNFFLGTDEELGRWKVQTTLEEGRTYATVVALEGGVTKIGDAFLKLDERQRDLLVRMLPVNSGSARPIDLFRMEYPEIWDLKVSIPGMDAFDVVGLFNWGKNRRYGVAEEERRKDVSAPLRELGLREDRDYLAYEYWSGSFLGRMRGTLSLPLDPRRVAVVALAPDTGHPQFLSTNRHITQGATDMKRVEWDEAGLTLTGVQSVDPDFEYSVTIHVPAGYALKSAALDGQPILARAAAELAILQFRAPKAGTTTWKLAFEKAQ